MNEGRAIELKARLVSGRVGTWTIGSLIGWGGSAAVFEGTAGSVTAAVKIIDPDLVEEFGREAQRARVNLEAKLAGHEHPNLVKIIEASECQDTGLLFVAMQRLNHTKLSAHIGSLGGDQIAEIFRQTVAAAAYLDEQGICHRDIKPDNIMVSADLAQVVLMDLGIILPFSRPETATDIDPSGERFIGTARYCPPEFVRSMVERSAEGYRSLTFYQLGAVLHDLIMGEKLFGEISGPYAVLLDAISNRTPLIESAEVPTYLLELARDCLQKDPHRRLKLVDFSRLAKPEFNISLSARERVRATLAASFEGISPAAAPGLIERSIYRDAAYHVRDLIRKVCTDNSDFYSPTVDHDHDDGTAMVTAAFDASGAHQITRPFQIRFTIRCLDPVQRTFDVEATPSWQSVTDVGLASFRVCLMRGVNEDISVYIEDVIYRVIAAAILQPHSASSNALKIGD
ncbi:protein kinase domain-containing protein [Rhizobium sp. ZW T2_16]|uniref:protein kinase domain-containing protein n=1 Tax=Rhizobium sp. ZW T2_16 TaxID=3378083 RepID=UPI00385193F8